MQRVIPIFYSEYGRYISRFRAVPLYVDALKPVERRLLLSLNQVAKNRFVKSAKVIGHVIGTYHPHGDASAYGTLVDMVKRGMVQGEGNFGVSGLEDDPAAAMRYTEVKSQQWINDMAFKYCKPEFVPWEDLELDPEPIYLPSPLPIGLIGEGVITGISFYTTTIPRYNYKDLTKRLVWLLEKTVGDLSTFNIDGDEPLNPKKFGPIIKPQINNCSIIENEPNAYYKLLLTGETSLRIVPNGDIDSKKKIIHIKGKAPLRHGFNILTKKCDGIDSKGKTLKIGKIDAKIKDLSKGTTDIAVFPDKPRSQDLNTLASEVWEVVSPNINFNCQFCSEDGKLYLLGIDKVLLASYQKWVQAVLRKKAYDCNTLYDKFFDTHIIHYIRQLDLQTITSVDDIVNAFVKQSNIPNINCQKVDLNSGKSHIDNRTIKEEDVRRVCSNKNIRQLIEVAIDFNKIQSDINNTKKSIKNNDKECLNELKTLL